MRCRVLPWFQWVCRQRTWFSLFAGVLISLLLALTLAPLPVRAESPFNDLTRPRPQGWRHR